MADEELDRVCIGTRALEFGDEALAERVVRAAVPGLLTDPRALPASLEVAGAGHPLAVAGAVRGDDPLVGALPGAEDGDEVRGDRHDTATLLLLALAELAADREAGAREIHVGPPEPHRLLAPEAREAEDDPQLLVPLAEGCDAGVHLDPRGCDRRLRRFARHAELLRWGDEGVRLLVIVEPRARELNDFDELATGGVGAVVAVEAVVLEVGVPVREQTPGQECRAQGGAFAVDFVEVAQEQIERAGVADRRVGAENARALLGVALQELPEIRRFTSVTRLPSASKGGALVDLLLEFGRGSFRRELPAARRAVGVAPAHAPAVVPLVDTRHRFSSIHQGSIFSASHR